MRGRQPHWENRTEGRRPSAKQLPRQWSVAVRQTVQLIRGFLLSHNLFHSRIDRMTSATRPAKPRVVLVSRVVLQ